MLLTALYSFDPVLFNILLVKDGVFETVQVVVLIGVVILAAAWQFACVGRASGQWRSSTPSWPRSTGRAS